jgi:hypothetical protein
VHYVRRVERPHGLPRGERQSSTEPRDGARRYRDIPLSRGPHGRGTRRTGGTSGARAAPGPATRQLGDAGRQPVTPLRLRRRVATTVRTCRGGGQRDRSRGLAGTPPPLPSPRLRSTPAPTVIT